MPPSLRLIGYWASPDDLRWPDPARWVDVNWEKEIRERVIRHLEEGVPFVRFAAESWCRFGCMEPLGACELTDGVYVWPEGLAHYLKNHHLRLPEPFVVHCLEYARTAHHDAVIRWFSDPAVEEKPVDISWWMRAGNPGT